MMQITEHLRSQLRRIRRGQSLRFLRALLISEVRRRTRVPDDLLQELEEAGLGRVAGALRELECELDAAAEQLRREES